MKKDITELYCCVEDFCRMVDENFANMLLPNGRKPTIDESGIEDNDFYIYGWALKGKRLFADKPGFKRRRVSIALNEGKHRG